MVQTHRLATGWCATHLGSRSTCTTGPAYSISFSATSLNVCLRYGVERQLHVLQHAQGKMTSTKTATQGRGSRELKT